MMENGERPSATHDRDPAGGALSPSARARPALAFLVDNLFDGFEAELWGSVVQAARRADVDLFCFLGGHLDQPGRNAVLEHVGPERIDAVIGVFGSIGCYAPRETTEALVRRLAPLPVVSLGMELPGIPSLVIDNAAGMAALLDHVAGVHGRRRIAFIRGPALNAEAEVRFQAYREGLARHGLPFDPALVLEGGFDRDSGRRAGEALLAAGPLPDALIAANDDMALYALRALQIGGVAVPDDVLVAGFDDVLAASAFFPALTTVRQPFRALGERGVAAALALLRGEPVAPLATLPTELVVRRSCGCAPRPPVARAARAQLAAADAPALAAVAAAEAPFLAAELGEGWALPIARGLLQELDAEPGVPHSRRPLLAALEALAGRALALRLELATWRPAVEALLGAAAGLGHPGLPALVAEAGAFLDGLAGQVELALRIKADEEAKVLRRVCPPTQLSEAEFSRVLRAELPLLGARSFFLCRYLDGSVARVSLFVHYDTDGAVALEAPAAPFDPRRLVPGRFAPDRRHAYAVIPIHYRDERMGYAVCQLGPMDLLGYEVLGNQLASTLRVGELMGAVRRRSDALAVRVDERTRELSELQRRLVETAHRAGMAEIAIGVLHNVGNLLNSVNVSADRIGEATERLRLDGLHRVTELLDTHRGDLPAFFGGDPRGVLVPEYLRKVAEALEGERLRVQAEARELTGKTALIRETVNTLQEYARGEHAAQQPEPLELAALAEAALRIQEPALHRWGVEVERRFGPVAQVHAHRSRLVHVLVNLVKNAVEAMRTTPGARRLVVELGQEGGRAVVRVRDNGEGISAEHVAHLFSYGFTTKADGHGFGLHSCREHLAGLGGSLTAESGGPGQGATFTLTLPTSEPL